MRPFHLLSLLLALSAPAAAQVSPRLIVAYPPDGHQVAYDRVILEGSVSPGASLSIGGVRAEVAPDGLYTLWYPLKPGVNSLRLVTTLSGKSRSTVLKVTRLVRTALPSRPTAIRPGSVSPAGRLEFWDVGGDTPEERTFEVSFEGSPGGQARYRLGPLSGTLSEWERGRYRARVTLTPGMVLNQEKLTVTLTGLDGQTATLTSTARVSTGTGPATATQNPATVRGVGLNEATMTVTTLDGSPLLYPREGTQFLAVGREGEDLRLRLAPGLSALVTAEQVTLTRGLPPLPVPGTLTLDPAAPASDLRLRLPLGGARPPFVLEQTLGGRRLELTLYGLAAPPSVGDLTDPLLYGVQRESLGEGVTRLTFDLGTSPWGFQANFDAQDLVLTVRRPPALDPAQPLLGRTIVLDPGHGGSNKGGAGLLGIPEKGLTLPVAQQAAALLRAQGANVVLTRENDTFVGLDERGLLAEDLRADLLVSLHYNALPDGRGPRGVRGPEVYYTHPQAQPLAASILSELRATLPDLGFGAGLKPGANLALTRPTTQISLLVEMAYLTDAGNVRVMHSPEGQAQLARAVAAGITRFYAEQVGR